MPVATVPDLWADPLGTDPLLTDPLGGFVLGTSEGGSLGGTPFLPNELDNARLIVLAGFGADLTKDPAFWAANFVDITKDVLQDNGRTVSMKVGRQDWSSTAFPATCTFAVKNLTGDYSAYNPLSKNWPNLVPGTPIWVLLVVGGVYYTRYFGEATGFQPSWDVTGNYAITIISAAGVLRRLGGGTGQAVPLHSPLYRAIVASKPDAYWSCEGGTSTTQIPSSLPGGVPLTLQGAGSINGTLAGAAGSDTVVQLAATDGFHYPIAAANLPTPAVTSMWTVQFMYRHDPANTGSFDWPIRIMTAGTVASWVIQVAPSDGSISIASEDVNESPLNGFFSGGTISVTDGKWHHFRLVVSQFGANIRMLFYVDGVQRSGTNNATNRSDTVGQVTVPRLLGNPAQLGLSHLAVHSAVAADVSSAASGYTGETPAARFARLCGEEGIPYQVVGRFSPNIVMGAQGIDTIVNLLREAESTDAGVLYDGLGPGLQFQPLAARYNAAAALTLDASAGDLQPPYAPTDDLFGRANRGIVTRKNGATGVFEDTTGTLGTNRIGAIVGSPPTAPNYSTDAPVVSRAGWEVRKGTVDGFRYPSITINLRKRPAKAAAWLGVTPGSLISITPPYPAQLPTDALLEVVEGWQEDLSKLAWTVTPFCSRGDVYQVRKLGTSARVDTAGSTLTQPAAVGAASLSVASTGTVWGTSNLPCDFWVAGIRVTATAITGASSPQTFTVTGVTKQLYTGDTVRLWQRAYPGLG